MKLICCLLLTVSTALGAEDFLEFFADIEASRILTIERLEQLGDDSYREREAAQKALLRQPFVFPDLMAPLARSNDPELRLRVMALARTVARSNSKRMDKALRHLQAQSELTHAGALFEMIPYADTCGRMRLLRKCITRIGTNEIAAVVAAASSDSERTRAIAYETLGILGRSNEWKKPLQAGLKDSSDPARFSACLGLINRREPSALKPLLGLVNSTDPAVRENAELLLISISGQTDDFVDWIDTEGAKAAWETPQEIPKGIYLLGTDLGNWLCRLDGKEQNPSSHWTLKNRVLTYAGRDEGDNGFLLATNTFSNYTFLLEYRWPDDDGKDEGSFDSGIYVGITQCKWTWPKGVEIQLRSGDAGDFYFPGGFKAEINGKAPEGIHGPKFEKSSEHKHGRWNRMEVRVTDSEVEVELNGVFQNRCTGDFSTPTRVGFQMSESRIEFRRLIVIPNE